MAGGEMWREDGVILGLLTNPDGLLSFPLEICREAELAARTIKPNEKVVQVSYHVSYHVPKAVAVCSIV
jgi:hypothetical protein